MSDPQTTGRRGLVRRVRADLLSLRLFDHRWYRDAASQSTGSKRALYRHFLTDGWREGLDPNGWFSCAGYLRANPDVQDADLNPWLHFICSGRHEQRPLAPPEAHPSAELRHHVGPLTLEDTVTQAARGLVDEPYYLAAYPDVHATGLTAAEHFAAYGANEGRTPAPWFDVEYLRTHVPSYRVGPGNPLVDLLRITTGAPPPVPAPTTWWVDPDAATAALHGMQTSADVLVVIHAYYPQDLDVFSTYLARLGPSVQVVMTCPAGAAQVCERWAAQDNRDATVVETINRGRDWGPFLAVAGEIGHLGWSAGLKLHTKRSPHRDDGAAWLTHVLDGLVPNEADVSSVLSLLADAHYDILAAPGTLSSAKGWEPESRLARQVYAQYVGTDDDITFPAGSMFWMSDRLLANLGGLALSVTDFEPELGQLDGTLAHGLERLATVLAPGPVGVVPGSDTFSGGAPPRCSTQYANVQPCRGTVAPASSDPLPFRQV